MSAFISEQILNVREELLDLKLDCMRWVSVIIMCCGNSEFIQFIAFAVLVAVMALDWWKGRVLKDD